MHALQLISTEIPFLALNSTPSVELQAVSHFDDGVSQVIAIPERFPFGNRLHSTVYVNPVTISKSIQEYMCAYIITFSINIYLFRN